MSEPPPTSRDLGPMMSPSTVAVIGASAEPGSKGLRITRNLILGGFTGVVYPVNPNQHSLFGIRCADRIDQIDEPVDLAVLVVPGPKVLQVVNEAADVGTRHFVIASTGFGEAGEPGRQRQSELAELIRDRALTAVGPNCLGLVNTDAAVSMNAALLRQAPPRGRLGLISQSGALCAALLEYAQQRRAGFSKLVSLGDRLDVDEVDLLGDLAADPSTSVIVIYLQSLRRGRDFVEAAYRVTRGLMPNQAGGPKPVLLLRGGRPSPPASESARAASHTAALAEPDAVYDAAMDQCGVIRLETVEELFDYARALCDPLPLSGKRTAIVTNAWGPARLAADACDRRGLSLAHLQPYTLKSLRFQMPPNATPANPMHLLADADHRRYQAALDAVMADEAVDQGLIIVAPHPQADIAQIAEAITQARRITDKPVAACLMGFEAAIEGAELLRTQSVPVYAFPESAVRSLAERFGFTEWVNAAHSRPQRFDDVDRSAAWRLLEEARQRGQWALSEPEALRLLSTYGLPVIPFELCDEEPEAMAVVDRWGEDQAVAMKVYGPGVLHKTQAGGVRLHLRGREMIRRAFRELSSLGRRELGRAARPSGVMMQRMLEPGKELILGAVRREPFGAVLMCGLGGIYAQAMNDVCFALPPLREDEAQRMPMRLRASALLRGVRREPPADLAMLTECLRRLSQLILEQPAIAELDINPLMVYPRGQGVMAVDAKALLTPQPSPAEEG